MYTLIDQRTTRRNKNTSGDTALTVYSPADSTASSTATAISAEVASSISISREEFLGVMAEAEFYNLFKETFQELDYENTGYVKAGDLDDVLGGIRDLTAPGPSYELDENSMWSLTLPQEKHHKTTSLIDVDDQYILVDYEQFTKMLLGAAL